MNRLLKPQMIYWWSLVFLASIFLAALLQRMLITEELIISTLQSVGIPEENLSAAAEKTANKKDINMIMHFVFTSIGTGFYAFLVISIVRVVEEDKTPVRMLLNAFVPGYLIMIFGHLLKFFLLSAEGNYSINMAEKYFPLSLVDIVPVDPSFRMYFVLSYFNVFDVLAALLWAFLVDTYLSLKNGPKTILVAYLVITILYGLSLFLVAESEKGFTWG